MESRPPTSDGSLLRVRDSLSKRFQRAVRARARESGISLSEFQDWVDELVGEGIAVALNRLKDWDPDRGDFIQWSYLQTRTLIERDLIQRRRRVSTTEYLDELTRPKKKTEKYDPVNKLLVKERLKSVFEELTTDQGHAIILRYLMHMKIEEMQSITGRSDVSLYSLLRRAKAKAREAEA